MPDSDDDALSGASGAAAFAAAVANSGSRASGSGSCPGDNTRHSQYTLSININDTKLYLENNNLTFITLLILLFGHYKITYEQ